MIIDDKSPEALTQAPAASTSDRKLSIELPNLKQIYTTGSAVTGIVHLGAKDIEGTLEVKVSIVCIVRSVHHKYYGGTSHDYRRETNKLIEVDHVLWSSSNDDTSRPPMDIPFSIIIPDVGDDKKAKNPHTELPPSFHAGSRRGWKAFGTYGTPIGFIKYHVKAVVTRKGTFTRHNKAFLPFVFLPPSPPPPLLPALPESDSGDPTHLPNDVWDSNTNSTNLRSLFSTNGHATVQLWLPRVLQFPRMMRIPFILCFSLITQNTTEEALGIPPTSLLPPPAYIDKATLFLRRTIRTCARGGRQTHVHDLDASPVDNMLYGLRAEENEWTQKSVHEDGIKKMCWEKRYIWRGMWTCRETPNFVNRQITWEYTLVGEVPIKGLGNGAKLVSRPLEIGSGVMVGTSFYPNSEEDALDLPPDYFETDGTMHDENDDEEGGLKGKIFKKN